MRNSRVVVVLLAVVIIASSIGATFEVPAGYLHEAFNNGETLQYSLSWLSVVGGSGTMTIGPDPVNAAHFRITSVAVSRGVLGRLYPVRDEIESTVDRKTFSTIRFQKILNERKKRKEELTVINTEKGIAMRKGEEFPVPSSILDPLSVMYYIRTLPLAPGKTFPLRALGDGKVYEGELRVYSRQRVSCDAGTFDTLMVEPKIPGGGVFGGDDGNRLLFWISDDERRLPVRIRSEIRAGTVTASLRSFRVEAAAAKGSGAK